MAMEKDQGKTQYEKDYDEMGGMFARWADESRHPLKISSPEEQERLDKKIQAEIAASIQRDIERERRWERERLAEEEQEQTIKVAEEVLA
jgi:hypothetical protein